jgi:choline monooxygenase
MPDVASLLATPQVLEPQPADTARALPAGFYTDAASVELDRHAVFARSWQLVAHAGLLSAGGDHVVANVAGVPILVVRGADGVLRALHNVCRHRAGPLATCDGRGARRLHCQYHGWTYDLQGRLLSAPEMTGAKDFDVSAVRLPAARVGEWQGLVFVALENATPPLEEMLAGMDARLGTRSLAGLRFHRRVDYEVACNWKVYVENYLEGYHIPHLHPELNRMLDYRSYVTETAPWYSLQYSPLESDATL